MPRKLKTYVTSVGFFDLAVAAPSMKAALAAWGGEHNLFTHGFAHETDDRAIVAATMAKPGVVLKRALGSRGAFKERAALPKSLPVEKPAPIAKIVKPNKLEKTRPETKVIRLAKERAAREAARAFERAEKKRAEERRKAEAADERARVRRHAAMEKAQAALERARARHESAMKAIARERAALDKCAEFEETRWDNEEKKLEAALRKAGE